MSAYDPKRTSRVVQYDLAGRTGRLPCPAFEGARTSLAVAEQPSNLRDRQILVCKISLGEI